MEPFIGDEKTRAYYNKYATHYNPAQFEFALQHICRHQNPDTRLIDVGCGDGAILSLIRQNTRVRDLTGMDISKEYLSHVEKIPDCKAILGSILDPELANSHAEEYDFCTLARVFHHLVGRSRRESYQIACRSLNNALKLLKPGGYLIILEPTYKPAFLMSAVFHIKRLFSGFSDSRIHIGKSWMNIGPPVVSFYTASQMDTMVNALDGVTLVERELVDKKRMGIIIEKAILRVVLQKAKT